ncbi:SIS domain-containing protein [Lentisphaera marina]|uniref:SIS domain-containing protein n=1 Tax=Lentisphaera marina TaxID=1111041 RepID=UPI002365AB2F|nr:SIS domain-containing protein [Lentisphaera marina]MDD7985719.1 SIS domain-containing protein [Lentisphaera marina]
MNSYKEYMKVLAEVLDACDTNFLNQLYVELEQAWHKRSQVFICGNGGSSANAMHIANDFIYGVCPVKGLNVNALSSNSAVLTCLANDTGYENIYSNQIKSLAQAGDLLIVLSGSGNSQNLINAIKAAKETGLKTCGILGFDGGICKALVDIPIHFDVNDMQISEDCQTIVGHMLMQKLNESLKDV